MAVLQGANLGLRFLLELCALAALGYWGVAEGPGLLWKIVLGVGAPLLAAVVWGLFVAPRATMPVSGALRLLLEAAVFGSAAVALAAAGRPTLAVSFTVVVVLNEILLRVWNQ